MRRQHQPQMMFAAIGTLHNTINNELEDGVTHQKAAAPHHRSNTGETLFPLTMGEDDGRCRH